MAQFPLHLTPLSWAVPFVTLLVFCSPPVLAGPGCPDNDGDGYLDSSCGGDDCDDNDASANLDDADGDGYTSCAGEVVVDLVLTDADGDGWTNSWVPVFLNFGLWDLFYFSSGFGPENWVLGTGESAPTHYEFQYEAPLGVVGQETKLRYRPGSEPLTITALLWVPRVCRT